MTFNDFSMNSRRNFIEFQWSSPVCFNEKNGLLPPAFRFAPARSASTECSFLLIFTAFSMNLCNEFSMNSQCICNYFPMTFQRIFYEFSTKFHWISMKFNEFATNFLWKFNAFSITFQWIFNAFPMNFQWIFKEFSTNFPACRPLACRVFVVPNQWKPCENRWKCPL